MGGNLGGRNGWEWQAGSGSREPMAGQRRLSLGGSGRQSRGRGGGQRPDIWTGEGGGRQERQAPCGSRQCHLICSALWEGALAALWCCGHWLASLQQCKAGPVRKWGHDCNQDCHRAWSEAGLGGTHTRNCREPMSWGHWGSVWQRGEEGGELNEIV